MRRQFKVIHLKVCYHIQFQGASKALKSKLELLKVIMVQFGCKQVTDILLIIQTLGLIIAKFAAFYKINISIVLNQKVAI